MSAILLCPTGLTHRGQLRHTSNVRRLQESGFTVVNILNLNDELRLGFQQSVRVSVSGLGTQCIKGLELPVQSLGGMDVPGELIDDEDGSGTLSGNGVFDGAITFV